MGLFVPRWPSCTTCWDLFEMTVSRRGLLTQSCGGPAAPPPPPFSALPAVLLRGSGRRRDAATPLADSEGVDAYRPGTLQ